MIDMDYMTELNWHKKNDRPSPEWTPIWNKYLQAGCVSKMTKEEALKQGMFYLGDIPSAAREIADERAFLISVWTEGGMPKQEAEEKAKQEIPYEYLFLRMM